MQIGGWACCNRISVYIVRAANSVRQLNKFNIPQHEPKFTVQMTCWLSMLHVYYHTISHGFKRNERASNKLCCYVMKQRIQISDVALLSLYIWTICFHRFCNVNMDSLLHVNSARILAYLAALFRFSIVLCLLLQLLI